MTTQGFWVLAAGIVVLAILHFSLHLAYTKLEKRIKQIEDKQ